MKNIVQTFYELSYKASEVLNNTYDCRKAEPFYIEILELIKANPNHKEQFVNAFLLILKNGDAPWELIQFCMRELQWSEIKEAAIIERETTHDWRIIAVMNDILAVYEDDWEDADLYKYYSEIDEKEKGSGSNL